MRRSRQSTVHDTHAVISLQVHEGEVLVNKVGLLLEGDHW